MAVACDCLNEPNFVELGLTGRVLLAPQVRLKRAALAQVSQWGWKAHFLFKTGISTSSSLGNGQISTSEQYVHSESALKIGKMSYEAPWERGVGAADTMPQRDMEVPGLVPDVGEVRLNTKEVRERRSQRG